VVRGDLRLWLGALACAVVVCVTGSQDVFWSGDFYVEAFPAYKLLMAGDVHGYLQHLPGYTGFALAVGAPASLLTELLGGAETMAFRLTALPGLVALAALAVALAGHARRTMLKGWPLVLVLTADGPLVLQTLKFGHPEDLLATAAAVGAVLSARDGRPTAAGLLLVVAVLAKQRAVLAIGPALLAAPAGHWRIAVIAALGSLAIVGAEMLYHPLARGGLTSTADLFHPTRSGGRSASSRRRSSWPPGMASGRLPTGCARSRTR